MNFNLSHSKQFKVHYNWVRSNTNPNLKMTYYNVISVMIDSAAKNLKRYCTIRKIGTVPSNDESIIYFIQSQGLYICTKMIIQFFATGRVYVVDATRCHVGKYIAMKWCNANYLIFLCRQKGFSDKIIAVDLESGLKKLHSHHWCTNDLILKIK